MSARRPTRAPSARFYRFAALALAAAAAACRPDAAARNQRGPGDEFDPTVVLDGGRADRAEGAMVGATEGYQPRPLVPASDGVRWEDVETAMTNTARRSFVGITGYEVAADRVVGSAILADGQRGTVTAERSAAGAISFRAQLGALPDPRRDRAFERDCEVELRRLGALRRPQP